MDDALWGERDCYLVAQAKAGDREAFARLYEGHYEAIRRYLCTALRETHEAEDAAQDVFVRALRALPDYEPR
ncbi:MAG TPA: sigma factor, partial [Solirubrobacteraceae bacterium]